MGRVAGSASFWVILIAVVAGASIARAVVWSHRLPPPMPVLGTVPDFALTREDGRAWGSQQLRGKVWVANFIYTRCPTICPAFTRKMYEVQHRGRNLGDAFQLVSFSADPDYDTPARLGSYAREHRASPRAWAFVTGPYENVKATVVQGLKVGMGREGAADDFASIFHGSHFVLVDARMRIRGYFDSSTSDAVDRVLQAAGLLLNRGE